MCALLFACATQLLATASQQRPQVTRPAVLAPGELQKLDEQRALVFHEPLGDGQHIGNQRGNNY